MTVAQFSLVIVSVMLSALAQVLLKVGMSQKDVQLVLSKGHGGDVASAILTNPAVMSGLSLYGFSAILWLFVLSKIELSVAYPFVGLGFILTMLCGLFLLGETISLSRIAGTLLIAVGCVLVARSA